MPQSAEKELEQFLAALPACIQKALLYRPMSAEELLESLNSQHKEGELRSQLERILRRIPGALKEYRKRKNQDLREYGRWGHLRALKGKPGRPRKDTEAEHFVSLHSRKSYPEIAKQELRKELESMSDKEAKKLLVEKEAERIRQSVRRFRNRKNS